MERLDGFRGTQEEYIRYIEHQIVTQRTQCSCRLQARPRTPPTSSESGSSSERPPELHILPWFPGRDLRSNKVRARSPRWKVTVDVLVKLTPTSDDWWPVLDKSGVSAILSAGGPAAYFIKGATDVFDTVRGVETAPHKPMDPGAGPIEALTGYAHDTMQYEQTASTAMALINFQKFLILSACAVLVDYEEYRDPVQQVVSIVAGREISARYRKQLMEAAKLLNELIDQLTISGWSNRASELVLLCEYELSRIFDKPDARP